MRTEDTHEQQDSEQIEYLYYIASTWDEYVKIHEEGLSCSEDGYIRNMVTDPICAPYIAIFQLNCNEQFGMIQIDPKAITGIVESVIEDEYTAPWQVKIKQEYIPKNSVKGVNMYWLDKEKVKEHKQKNPIKESLAVNNKGELVRTDPDDKRAQN